MLNRRKTLGLKIPTRLGKNVRKFQGGIFLHPNVITITLLRFNGIHESRPAQSTSVYIFNNASFRFLPTV